VPTGPTVRRFAPALRDDFFRLHSAANGAGWCHCVAWWVSSWDGWGGRSSEENRELRERLLDSGQYDGYVLLVDDEPAAWCQVGPRDRLEKVVRQFHREPDPRTWAVTCFFVAPAHRRKGLAAALLRGALQDLARRGVRRVEAYPRRGIDLAEDDAWTGPEAMFLAEGFTVERDDASRPVLSLVL
jgi:GNAT superfamily N-acetyltransferase